MVYTFGDCHLKFLVDFLQYLNTTLFFFMLQLFYLLIDLSMKKHKQCSDSIDIIVPLIFEDFSSDIIAQLKMYVTLLELALFEIKFS